MLLPVFLISLLMYWLLPNDCLHIFPNFRLSSIIYPSRTAKSPTRLTTSVAHLHPILFSFPFTQFIIYVWERTCFLLLSFQHKAKPQRFIFTYSRVVIHLTLQRKKSMKEEMNAWQCLPSKKARVVAMHKDTGRCVLQDLLLPGTISPINSLNCTMKTACFTV